MGSHDESSRQDIVERQGLRFQILCECYALKHKAKNPYRIVFRFEEAGRVDTKYANSSAKNLSYVQSGSAAAEIVAAEEYLVESDLLYGTVEHQGIITVVTNQGIGNRGVDLVETVVLQSRHSELRDALSVKSVAQITDFFAKYFKLPLAPEVEEVRQIFLSLMGAAFPPG